MESIQIKDDTLKLETDKNYTVPETAKILRVSTQTIYNKLHLGEKLPSCFRVGGRVLFQGSAILEFIEKQK